MNTETSFLVTEWYNKEMQDFVQFQDPAEAYATATKYVAKMKEQLDETETNYTERRGVSLNGDFFFEIRTEGECYSIEGFTHTNIVQ